MSRHRSRPDGGRRRQTSWPAWSAHSRSTPARRAPPRSRRPAGARSWRACWRRWWWSRSSRLPGVLHDVPVAALSGVLLFIATRIVRMRELRAIARFDRIELALALVTLADRRPARRRAGHRRGRGARDPRSHAAQRPPAAARAGPDTGHHELGAAGGPRAAPPRSATCSWCCSRHRSGTRTRSISARSCAMRSPQRPAGRRARSCSTRSE